MVCATREKPSARRLCLTIVGAQTQPAAMKQLHALTDLQLAIMGVVWERREATVGDVHAALLDETGLARKTIGTLLALATLLGRLYGPLTGLSNVRIDVMTALVSFERVFEVLDLPSLIEEKPDAVVHCRRNR